MDTILSYLPPTLKEVIQSLPPQVKDEMEEIRIRINQPLEIIARNVFFLPHIITAEEGQVLINKLSHHSFYALDEELRCGYLTIEGGHRVGLAGKVILEQGKVKAIRHLSSFNLRIAREKIGAAQSLIPSLYHGRWKSTLIIGPPQSGKTTLLRDVARVAASGDQAINISAVKVGIVDERSEIAGCVKGIPQLDVGTRTDVLDACPKAEGMMMMIRSMSPEVLIADEIGREEDGQAVAEAMNAGIALMATVHGTSLKEVIRRPMIEKIVQNGAFERFIELAYQGGERVFHILDEHGKKLATRVGETG
ncbi:stage III sporulation protein AA [Bacillus sp. REN10]|uniref:stage III sporulation protein AA n=1 Tax=Bacillus sp. REN10 TaxID=2782541 RepID=UPI00193BAADE